MPSPSAMSLFMRPELSGSLLAPLFPGLGLGRVRLGRRKSFLFGPSTRPVQNVHVHVHLE
jgi:hypothetical protein